MEFLTLLFTKCLNYFTCEQKNIAFVAVLFGIVIFCFANEKGDNVMNPVLPNYKMHDACLIDGEDGYYYIFSTCNASRNKNEQLVYYGVNLFKSEDLLHWKFYNLSLNSNSYYKYCSNNEERKQASKGCYPLLINDSVVFYPIWAPEVIRYKGKYLLFAALRRSFKDSNIAVFEADSINSYFKFKRLVVSSVKGLDAFFPSKELIDPTPIIDEGNFYLVFGSFSRNDKGQKMINRNGIGVYIVELNKENYSMKGEPVFLTDYYEGVTIVKRKGKYYLFGTNGWSTDNTYKISYAKSDRLFGPYNNIFGKPISDTIKVNLGNVILETKDKNLKYNGFGCMSRPVIDKCGRYWVLLNGHDLGLPPIVDKSSSRERYTFLVELHWSQDNEPYFNLDEILKNDIKKPCL